MLTRQAKSLYTLTNGACINHNLRARVELFQTSLVPTWFDFYWLRI